ncbi:MAG: hypothetical protein GKR89_12600 [Candidatus Latescibacteria bacterium]|nr:hypothetical protein [Candidatus Latescibacterota bacterium]
MAEASPVIIRIYTALVLVLACRDAAPAWTPLLSSRQTSLAVKTEFLNNKVQQASDHFLVRESKIRGRFPTTTENGQVKFQNWLTWFSGFPGGEAWYLYFLTGREDLLAAAEWQTDWISQYANIDNTHDMGFLFSPTCATARTYAETRANRNCSLAAADKLVERFLAQPMFIPSSGSVSQNTLRGRMIIDTLMNLKLLYWAAAETGDGKYLDIVRAHLETAIKYNVRHDDFSSFQEVLFDEETWQVTRQGNHQGLHDGSTWARGQAWGIYGFAEAHGQFGDIRYLELSEKMLGYYRSHTPSDLIPNWDLSLIGDHDKDSSAAVVVASALFILAENTTGLASRGYIELALRLSDILLQDFFFTASQRTPEDGTLLRQTYFHGDAIGNDREQFPNGQGIEESMPVGDYYLAELLFKLSRHFAALAPRGQSEIRIIRGFRNPFPAGTAADIHLSAPSPLRVDVYNLLGPENKNTGRGRIARGPHACVLGWPGPPAPQGGGRSLSNRVHQQGRHQNR